LTARLAKEGREEREEEKAHGPHRELCGSSFAIFAVKGFPVTERR